MRKFLIISVLLLGGLIVSSQTLPVSFENHVKYLASDKLEGRYPGTKGNNSAAKYIRKFYKKNGLKLLYDNGFQFFTLKTTRQIEKASFGFSNQKFELYTDFVPVLASPDGQYKAKAVFAGYGLQINGKQKSWDDYKNLDVKGKWVIVFRGIPQDKTYPRGFFRAAGLYAKIKTAQKNGALGLIVVNDFTNYPKDELIRPCIHKVNQDFPIPVISISRKTSDKIFENCKTSVQQIENQYTNRHGDYHCTTPFEIAAVLKIKTIVAKTQNVVAMVEGTDSQLKNQYIVVGAHYDHLGFGGCGSGSLRPDTVAVHNGADDNASGTAAVLELAKYFAQHPQKRSIIFVNFSAEEEGIVGSSYFVKHLPVPKKDILAMVNFDMVGNSHGNLDIMGLGSAKNLDTLVKQVPNNCKNLKISYTKEAIESSDHAAFYNDSIPVLFFYASNAKNYHTPDDDWQLLDYQGEANVVNYAVKIIEALAQTSEKFDFVRIKTKNTRKLSIKVRMGIMPDFAQQEILGLKIAAVSPNHPADKAGIKTNDIIVAINGEAVKNIYDYMYLLSKLEIGDTAEVTVLRNGKKINFKVKF